MIEGLSLIILGLIIVNALYDCLRYYKKMETNSLKIRCVIGYLGFSFAIAHIFYFIYNNQCIGGLKSIFLLMFSMGILTPIFSYFIISARILNADYRVEKYQITLPKDYQWWNTIKRMALIFLVVNIVVFSFLIYENISD
jgi:uncharacterized membrane protein YidH (DUF202 family)